MIDGARIRERLKAVGLTANAASEKAGLGRSYIRDILRGRINSPSAWRLQNLADVLQTSPGFLQGGTSKEWDLNPADDRTPERAREVTETINKVRRTGAVPPTRLMFDLLDSVSDGVLIGMAYEFIASDMHIYIEKSGKLLISEINILCGERENIELDNFIRRISVLKLLEYIDKETGFELALLGKLYFAEYPKDLLLMKLDDEEIEKILGGAVRRVSNKYNAEAARLYILTLFAKIVGIRPLEGDKKEVA